MVFWEGIVNIIEEVLEKITEDTKIILLATILEKKSKLRLLFETNKNIVCIPFYADNNQTLSSLANYCFKEKKIPIIKKRIYDDEDTGFQKFEASKDIIKIPMIDV